MKTGQCKRTVRAGFWLIIVTAIALYFFALVLDAKPRQRASTTVQFSENEPSTQALQASGELGPVSIFIGIFSTPERAERRKILRQIYGRVKASSTIRDGDTVVIKHILGNASDSSCYAEQAEHGDLEFLPVSENMDDGKSWHYFVQLASKLRIASHLPDHDHEANFDFVAKVDDDAYINLPALLNSLRPYRGLTEVYHGRLCNAPSMPSLFYNFPYHCGFCYTLSADLVSLLGSKSKRTPPVKYCRAEDVETAGWLVDANKTANFVSLTMSRMYSSWEPLPRNVSAVGTRSNSIQARSNLTGRKLELLLGSLDQRDIAVHGLKHAPALQRVADWFYEHGLSDANSTHSKERMTRAQVRPANRSKSELDAHLIKHA
jgi:hypothetical protein